MSKSETLMKVNFFFFGGVITIFAISTPLGGVDGGCTWFTFSEAQAFSGDLTGVGGGVTTEADLLPFRMDLGCFCDGGGGGGCVHLPGVGGGVMFENLTLDFDFVLLGGFCQPLRGVP